MAAGVAVMLAVAGGAYDTAADAWAAGNLRAVDALDDLAAGLALAGGMGGDDTSSEQFVSHYDDGARATSAAVADLAEAFAALARLTDVSSQRHRAADAHATAGAAGVTGDLDWVGLGWGARAVVVPSHAPPPSALGSDGSATPALWDLVVDHLQGWTWPSADVDRLRTTATLWRQTGHRVRDLAADLLVGDSALADQRSPEVPLALAASAELRGHCDTLARACADLAEACTDHADQVAATREAVRDLLEQLAIELAASAAMSGALSLLTFGGSAVAYAAFATARAVACARRVVDVLKTLTSIRAVSVAARTLPEARGVAGALQKFKNIEHVIQSTKRLDDHLFSPGTFKGPHAERRNLLKHVIDHHQDFGTPNPDNYLAAAKSFLRDPPAGTWARVRDWDGSILRYDPKSEILATMYPDGRVRTFYKPDIAEHGRASNMDYFLGRPKMGR